MELSNNYSTIGFSGKVPIKEWKTANGKKFVSELKETIPIEQIKDKLAPSIESFKTIEAKLPNITYCQKASNGELSRLADKVGEVNHEAIAKKLVGWLPKS